MKTSMQLKAHLLGCRTLDIEEAIRARLELVGCKSSNGSRMIMEFPALDTSQYSLQGIQFKLIPSPIYSDLNCSIGETEVTQELFVAVMGFNPSYFKNKPDSLQRPVEMVSWYDCILFCNRLSILMGLPPSYDVKIRPRKSVRKAEPPDILVSYNEKGSFRLPKPEEWKAFAMASTNNAWAGTTEDYMIYKHGWFDGNSNNENHPVAQLIPNEWGLYDMSGNLAEWTEALSHNGGLELLTNLEAKALGGSFLNSLDKVKIQGCDENDASTKDERTGFRICRTILTK